MKYKGSYWTFFAPLIKRSVRRRFGNEMAKKSIKRGKVEYRRILREADDLGTGNPMAMNAYFAYVFVGAWLGSEKKLSVSDMGLVMGDVLRSLRFYFAMTDLNKDPKKWYRDMKKYEAWERKQKGEFSTWKVSFNEELHKDGSYYVLSNCPICEFCRKQNMIEIMPTLCNLDQLMFEMQHGVLHREHTIANGDEVCDYWVYGNKVKNPT